MKRLISIVLATALAAPGAFAEEKSRAGTTEMSAGEVRKLDKDAKKIAIKHGPIQNLEMPAMTMVFRVQDAAMLDQVKAGDKIRFRAENVGGVLTVTKIERAN